MKEKQQKGKNIRRNGGNEKTRKLLEKGEPCVKHGKVQNNGFQKRKRKVENRKIILGREKSGVSKRI